MKQPRFWGRLGLDLLLLVPGVLGALFCLITAFELPVPPALLPLTLIAAVGFCLALGRKKRDLPAALLLLLLLLLLALRFREALEESFLGLWGELSTHYAKGYEWLLDYVPREPLGPDSTGPALLALGVLMSGLGAFCVRTWKRTLPCALVLLLGVGPCFILTDTPPALLPLLGVVATVLIQAVSESARRREDGPARAAALGALLSALLLGLVLLAFPQDRYAPPITWEELAEKLRDWNDARNNRGYRIAGLSGNPETVNLSGLGALPTKSSPVLRLRADQGGRVYLRGSAYALFDGQSWSWATEAAWEPQAMYPDWNGPSTARVQVETIHVEPALYTVSRITSPLPSGAAPVSDAYLDNTSGIRRYTLFYRRSGDFATDPDYEAWVLANCLDLPQQTKEEVLAWWEAQGGKPLPEQKSPTDGLSFRWDSGTGLIGISGQLTVDPLDTDLETYARQVAAAVSKCADYSRNPPKVPQDRDFSGWFLTEAGEGYCVHYATACTALLRALGIPARYVTGYVCEPQPNVTETVRNLNAHAWVEAWIDGRWVTVEPTPDSAAEFSGGTIVAPGPGGASQETVYVPGRPVWTQPPVTEPPTTEPAPTESSRPWEEPTLPVKPGATAETEAPTAAPTTAAPEPSGSGSRPPAKEPADLTLLWVFLGAAGFLALTLGRRALAAELRKRRLARAKPNERARLLYRRLLRLSRHGGGEPPPEALALANKACFSQYTLDDEELLQMRQFADQAAARVAICGFWRRLYYRYVLAII